MRLGGVRGWCPRASPKAGASRGRGGSPGGGGGPQAGRKVGGDYPLHMDTTPKGPPVPPTPDILSSLSRRGISDLSIVLVPPSQPLRRHQRCRISSRRPPSLILRTSSSLTSFPSSPTCLDPLRPLCPVIERPPIHRRFFSVLENKCRTRESSIAAGSETILFEDSAITLGIDHRADGEFCTYHVFISRRRAFDAYFTIADQRRAGRSHRLTVVIFCVGEHIDRLRPQKRLTRKYSLKLRKQCRAALPHGLYKVSDLYLFTCDTCRILMMRQSATRLPALPYDNTCQHQWFSLVTMACTCNRCNMTRNTTC